MTRWRRLVRDYERRCDVSEVMIRISMGTPLLRRVAHPLNVLKRALRLPAPATSRRLARPADGCAARHTLVGWVALHSIDYHFDDGGEMPSWWRICQRQCAVNH